MSKLKFTKYGRGAFYRGDCLDIMRGLLADGMESTFDRVVTDPPYHLTSIVKRFGGVNASPAKFGTDGAFAQAAGGFMGKAWDGGDVAFRSETWELALRLLKPGGHLVAFGGPQLTTGWPARSRTLGSRSETRSCGSTVRDFRSPTVSAWPWTDDAHGGEHTVKRRRAAR